MNWELFRELLSMDSTTGKERAVAEWLCERLPADCPVPPQVERQEVGDGTLNLLLTWGTPKVVFCTHLDTVPPYIAPTFGPGLISEGGPRPHNVPSTGLQGQNNGPGQAPKMRPGPNGSPAADVSSVIYGRGACDAKGQVFAMFTACCRLVKEGCSDFGLLLLAGEETGSWGAKAFARTGFRAPFLIVGEPTENKMVSAAKGTLSYDLRFTGEAFHSGYPQYGVSAVELFNQFYNQLKAKDFGTDPLLGATTWNVGLLHSDNPQNILAPELTCRLYFRTTFVSHQAVQDWMERAGHDGKGSPGKDEPVTPGLTGGLEVTARGGDVPAQYVTFNGFASAPVAFGSDAPHLGNFGHKIICGPGSIRHAHRADEQITVQELEQAVDIYLRLYREIQSLDR